MSLIILIGIIIAKMNHVEVPIDWFYIAAITYIGDKISPMIKIEK